MEPFSLVVFLLVIVGVIVTVNTDVRIPLPGSSTDAPPSIQNDGNGPHRRSRRGISVNYASVPLVGVAVLLIGGAIGWSDVWNSVVGDDAIKPYTIMILFMSLAYVCISLDFTGALAFVSLKVVAAAGTSKYRLFLAFFLLTGALTAFTSNDIVILTLTPVVIYCSRFARINPKPYIFTMFFAANIFSFFLIISNPTNIIVGEAVGLSFAEFLKYMLLPGAVTCATALATLHFTFREDLRGALSLPNLDPESELQSRRGAVVHAATLGICLLFMCVSSAVPGVELWMVALGAACVSLAYNLAALPWRVPAPTAALPGPGSGPSPAALRGPSPRSNSSSAAEGADSSADLSDLGALGFDASAHTGAVLSARGLPASDADAGDQAGAVGGADAEVGADASAESGAHASQGKPQAHWPVVAALPWTLMPFVFGMFCLVQALLVHGWVDEFARWCVGAMGGAAVLRERDSGAAPLLASLFMMFATLLLCNTANNQPATILLTRVLLAPPMRALGPNAHRAAVLAVIAGSNISACLTPIGALAGILFCAVLETHKVKVTYGAFVRVGLAALPVALACALAVALIVAAT